MSLTDQPIIVGELINRLEQMLVSRIFIVVLLSLGCAVTIADQSRLDGPPMMSAGSWLVAERGSGEVRFMQNIDEVREIASITKLLHALVVMDVVAETPALLDAWVMVSEEAGKEVGTSARLETGERWRVRDLLYGMLLPSGNDAALVLANFVGRRLEGEEGQAAVDRFVSAMNDKARSLGMTHTQIIDVHGMGRNLSTAGDLLNLAMAALGSEMLREIVATPSHTAKPASRHHLPREWRNTNKLLGEFDGVKTGHTFSAGGCLILSGDHGEKSLIVILLGSNNEETRFWDAFNLYQWAFNR